MLAPLIVAINLPTLKYQLMSFFAIKLFCESQISIQTIAILDLEEILTTWGLEAIFILLKICDVLINNSMMLKLIGILVSSMT